MRESTLPTSYRAALLALATVLLSGCAADPVPRAEDPFGSEPELLLERVPEVDGYFSQLADEGLFNGAVLVAVDRKAALRESYTASGAPEGMAADLNDQFVLASVSKLLISYAAYAMAEDGRLSRYRPGT